jgi:pilus assembly protein CpaE
MTDVAVQPISGPPAPADTAMVFVRDRDSEGVIRQCLTDLSMPTVEFTNAGVDAAITGLKERPSPRLLVVDIHGIDDPAARIRALADVCDPETGVIVIGDVNDIRLYRDLKAAGVVEYFFKPLVRTLVMQACHGVLMGSTEQAPSRTGKLVFVVSVRGGSGGTTIAVATAWHMAETHKRRVGLIDLDLQYGDAALQMNVAPGHALEEALDHPERVDELFLERGMIQVGARLGLMAGLKGLDQVAALDENAVMSLLGHMLHRYRYLFVDIPPAVAPRLLHVLHLPGTVLLVSTASLACARDVARWRETIRPNSAERTTLHILNKSGASDGLPDEEFIRATGMAPDITIPFAREIGTASLLGGRGLQNCPALQRGLDPLFRQLSGEGPPVVRRSFLRGLLGSP